MRADRVLIGRSFACVIIGVALVTGVAGGQGADYARANYTKFEYRIPMRDGVKLFTSVYVPKDGGQKYPILLTRTPVQRGAVRRRRLQSQPWPVGPVHARWLHLRVPGRARPDDVGGRVRRRASAPGGEGRSAGHRREH